MTFLTLDQCAEWCEENGFPLSYISAFRYKYPDLQNSMFHRLEYRSPRHSGQKVALVKIILEEIAKQNEILLWCRNWNVVASAGHIPLLTRLRQALGEKRELLETPGHLANTDEKDDAASILILSLEFYWDCFAMTSDGENIFFVSYDEYWMLLSRDPSVIENAKAEIEYCNWE
jgi:hypothetical protein